MERYQYMLISSKYFTEEIRNEYDIASFEENGYLQVKIRKGIYGLKETGIIAFKRLVKNIAHLEYRPARLTPRLWKYDLHNITFTLVVDDFGIKYCNNEDLKHLLSCLQQYY